MLLPRRRKGTLDIIKSQTPWRHSSLWGFPKFSLDEVENGEVAENALPRDSLMQMINRAFPQHPTLGN